MKFKAALIASALLFGTHCFSQYKTYSLVFSPRFGNSELNTEAYYKIGEKDSLQITALKFYISGIEIWQEQKLVWKEKNSFHLIDISNIKSLNINLNLPAKIAYNEFKFNLGIDSITNVSGALGGALDPTLGMYWAWQSGYINFKLEGKSNLCKTRNNEFQFHLGGYQKPFLGLQYIHIKPESIDKSTIIIDIQKIINSVNLTPQNHIMSPCKEAVVLAEHIAKTMNTAEH